MIELKIICDSRERAVINQLQTIPWKTVELDIDTRQLSVADFVVSSRIGIERKRGDDFVNSMIDGRLDDELTRLKDTYEDPVLLLEDWDRAFNIRKKDGSFINISLNHIYGALAKARKMASITVSRDTEDTAINLVRMAYREQKEENQECFARHAPRMGTLRERQLYKLQGLLDTGPKLATRLLDHFGIPGIIYHAIQKTKFRTTPGGNKVFQKVDGEWPVWKEIQGVGVLWVLKNQQLLFGG